METEEIQVLEQKWHALIEATEEIRELARITHRPMQQIEEVNNFIHSIYFRGLMNKVVIIHDNDPDGHASNAIFRRCNPQQFEQLSVAVSHGKPFADFVNSIGEKFEEGGEFFGAGTVVILDHGVSKETSEKIMQVNHGAHLLVIDHHPETVNWTDTTNDKLFILKDTNWSTSGLCGILYQLTHVTARGSVFEPTPAYILSLLINYYDLWKFGATNNLEGEAASRAIASIAFHIGLDEVDWGAIVGQQGEMFYSSQNEEKEALLSVIAKGNALLETKAQVAYKVVTKSMTKRLLYLPPSDSNPSPERAMVGIVFHSDDIDNVASAAIKLNPGLDLVVMVYMKADPSAMFKLAIRARSGSMVTARAVAAHLGGGGHPCSAGAQISDLAQFFSLTHAIES